MNETVKRNGAPRNFGGPAPNQNPPAEATPPPAKPTTQLPATRTTGQVSDVDMADLFEGGVTGLENVKGVRDLLIPRLTILQKLSPQLNRSKPEFIEGARLGMFCDVGTNEVWDTLTVIPCFYARVFIQWAPRASGRGMVKNHGLDGSVLKSCKQDDRRRWVLANGDYIAETAQFYSLNLTANGRASFIPMAATQLQAARRWLTAVTAERIATNDGRLIQPPLFYRSWSASTREKQNAQGDWLLWYMEPGPTVLELDPSKELLSNAREFAKQASTGMVQGDMGDMGDMGGPGAEVEEEADDNERPF